MSHENAFPPLESRGGWPLASGSADVRALGFDPDKLAVACERQLLVHGGDSWSLVIVRRGVLVREEYTFNVLIPNRFDVWSCSKTFTGTAWGVLIDDSRRGAMPAGRGSVDFDSRAYDLIEAGHPLSDPRKAAITIEHLLTMTSGIGGEDARLMGMPTTSDVGPFEHALGRAPNRFGRSVATLAAEPGTRWDYSDPAMAHLSLAFHASAGADLHPFLAERVLNPIGI